MVWRFLICAVVCIMSTSVASADTLIFDNSSYTGYIYPQGGFSYTEMLDYGTSPGGRIGKFVFGYVSSSSQTVWVTIYQYTNSTYEGYQLKRFAIPNVPSTNGYMDTFEYVIPEDQRFELLNGYFGYSIESSKSIMVALATGGTGIDRYYWQYDDWYGTLYPYDMGIAYNIYFQLYTAPPINEVTCDITGWKFNDADGDGTWDTTESAMTGWEFFLDTNNDGIYQVSEPNTVTDPNGFYMFENVPSPATYRVREVMQDGWTQTLPGSAGNFQYLIATEPNTVYGPYNFGNTTMPQSVTLSGYVTKENEQPFVGIRVDLDLDGNLSTIERTTLTDSEGYYVFSLDVPWSGIAMIRLPEGWASHALMRHQNVTTNITENFVCYYSYDGGAGTLSNPYQLRTAEQLLMIDTLPTHWNKCFVLTDDIDLAPTVFSDPIIASVRFDADAGFSGTFDGAGHAIRNLKSHNGLFGLVRNGTIKDLAVENVDISGAVIAGAVCNYNHGGTIMNCSASGTITGSFDVGGICGCAFQEYKGDFPTGGWLANTPVISGCRSTVNVTTRFPDNWMYWLYWGTAGGLCGAAEDAQFSNNCARGRVEGVGCFALHEFTIIVSSGGLVGQVQDCVFINNYSTAAVIDGLAYSQPGGLCGQVTGTGNSFTGNYWDTVVTGQTTSAFGTPGTTVQMQTMSTYTGWDFANTWRICDGMNYPRLKWEPLPVGDFVCPEGVELADVLFMADQWLMTGPSNADIAPATLDGKINLHDFAELSAHWMEGTD